MASPCACGDRTQATACVKEVSAESTIPRKSFNQNEIFESTHPENYIDASDGDAANATVIGVKDCNFKTLHHNAKPLLIKLVNSGFNYFVLKLHINDFNKTIKEIEGSWNNFDKPSSSQQGV